MTYNAEHALYNGHKVWGYGVDEEKHYKSTEYLSSLEQQCRDVEKGLANFVRAIEAGIFNEATQRRMAEL